MNNLRRYLAVLCTLALLPALGSADEESVRSAVMDHYRAFAAKDHEGLGRSFAPGYTIFSSSGGLLREGFDRDRMKSGFKAGLTFNLKPRHIEVQLFENTAVVTGYLDARISMKKQRSRMHTLRLSSVWVKQKGGWHLAHEHLSRLVLRSQSPPARQSETVVQEDKQGIDFEAWLLTFADILF